jgi:hypothetical protein
MAGLALGGDWTGKPHEQDEKPYASVQRYAAQPGDSRFAAYPLVESNRCYSAKNHDSADLCAQWRAAIAAEKAADSAKWSNRLSLIGAVLTLFGLAIVLRGLEHSQQANLLTREANINDNRAWIEPLVVINDQQPLIWWNQSFQVPLRISLRNHGSTPAISASVSYRIVFSDEEAIAFANSIKNGHKPIGIYSDVVFPGEITEAHNMGISSLKGSPLGPYLPDENARPIIVLFAKYRTVFDPTTEYRTTVRMLRVEYAGGEITRQTPMIEAHRLYLAQAWMIEGYAT